MNTNRPISPNIAQQLAATDIPPNLVKWLARLKIFHGVPFNYLVSDPKLLPPESLKFFTIDHSWQKALLDGALSIGRHHSNTNASPTASITDQVHHESIHGHANREAINIRNKQVQSELLQDTPMEPFVCTGFLLRSTVVSGWPSMDISAYPKDGSPYDFEQGTITENDLKPLKRLRLERLSSDVMLGIFKDEIYELVLHQPPEAIHFGFQALDLLHNSVTKNLRVPNINWDDPNTKYDIESHQNQPLNNVFADTENRVLDMTKLSQNLATTLNSFDKAPAYTQAKHNDDPLDHLLSSDFALEMVKGMGLVSFINDVLPA